MRIERFPTGRFAFGPAWTPVEVRAAVDELLSAFADRLPASRDARVVIKPNLNNDLPALVGNSADLRVIEALLGALRDRGYRDLTVADGSNVGVERRGIDAHRRLRVDRVLARHGARWVDLNRDAGVVTPLEAGGRPRVASTVLDADLYLSLPKIKTHAEARLSCALKNQVGICVAQDKRHMHLDLGRNILALGRKVRPHLVLVDGLVGMEGNGPGDGDPARIGLLAMCDDPFLNDLAVARLVGFDWRDVPYLALAVEQGVFDEALAAEVVARLPVVRPLVPPPPRGALARLADLRALFWLKKAARPITDRPQVLAAARRIGVIQDVYVREDDAITGLTRDPAVCGTCTRCVEFCPTGLPLSQIGAQPPASDCVNCLYCWWACPNEAISLQGAMGQLERQARRYKAVTERL